MIRHVRVGRMDAHGGGDNFVQRPARPQQARSRPGWRQPDRAPECVPRAARRAPWVRRARSTPRSARPYCCPPPRYRSAFDPSLGPPSRDRQPRAAMARGERKQGRGSAPNPARGLCPLDPHQRQGPLDSMTGRVGRGRGRVGEAKGRRPACRTAPLRLAHPPPSPPHTPSEGFQEPPRRRPGLALGGVPRGSAPWWGPGRSPGLAFVRPIARACARSARAEAPAVQFGQQRLQQVARRHEEGQQHQPAAAELLLQVQQALQRHAHLFEASHRLG